MSSDSEVAVGPKQLNQDIQEALQGDLIGGTFDEQENLFTMTSAEGDNPIPTESLQNTTTSFKHEDVRR